MGMVRFAALGGLFFIILLAWSSIAVGQQQAESCVACHLSLGDARLAEPARQFPNDIHSAKGFSCVSCHGGDGTLPGLEAMDPAKGYIGKPKGQEVIQVCGRCHSDARFMRRYNPSIRVDQVTEYYTSIHGQRLRTVGDPKVATCANCHAAHRIRPPSDPRSSVYPLHVADTCGSCHANEKYMAPYKIPTDQLAKYKKSVHWMMMSVKGDLSAPTCNDCHGNHGAAPPGISWVGNVCGQCHSLNAELFAKSRHSQVFVQMGFPGCAICHGNHDIAATGESMLGLQEGAICARCHSAQDKGGTVAVEMRLLIDSLRNDYEKARAFLLKAEHAGMEVSQAQFELNDARTALVKARAAIHAFSLEEVKKETEAGLPIAAKAYARGQRALEELDFRRKGLFVSVAIILALIVGLVLKIRQMEQKK